MAMSSGDLLVKTLKRIGYQDADNLSESDLDALTSDEELKSFFEVFCTLNENNVLTTEEIEAYAALSPAEIEEIEILMKTDKFDDTDVEQEKKKQAAYLQEQLSLIENQNKALERQYDLFRKHEENVLQERENLEKKLSGVKKEVKTVEITKVAKAEEELVSNFKSCLKISEEVFQESASNHYEPPVSNFVKDSIQQYVKDEEKVVQCTNSYMQTNFQVCENGTFSFIHDEVLRQQMFGKESLIVKKKLKSSMFNNVMSEVKVRKTESILKHLETIRVCDIRQCPSSQIRLKLDDYVTLNEKLRKKEERYQAYLSDTISKHVDALVAEFIFSASKEMSHSFQFYSKKMSFPKKYLIRQRLRIEKLIASLSEQLDNFQNVKQITQKVFKQMEEEQLCLDKGQMEIQRELKNSSQSQLPEEIFFSFLRNILATPGDFNVSNPPADDIIQKANKFFQVEGSFREICAENMKVIDSMENQAECSESLFYAKQKYSGWQDLEQSFNRDLNYLVKESNCFVEGISDCDKDMDEKQKLLEKRRNLQLARRLFVHALMNRELFEKYIQEIKFAAQNSIQ